MELKIAYCGYDYFHSSLESLLLHGYKVAKVFSVDCNNQDYHNQYVLDTCNKHNIPYTLTPINAEDIIALEQEGFNILISAAYNFKVPDLSASGIRGINIHPTYLPTGRGVWPLPWIILLNKKMSGVTLHKLNAQWDAGDIVLQDSFPVSEDEILETLNVKCQRLAQSLLLKFIDDPDQYWNTAKTQTIAEYWPMPSKQDRTLVWSKSVDELDRISRAFGKHGCFTHFNQHDWIVFSLKTWKESHSYTPGTVVHKTNTEMVVAAADGLVDLLYFRTLT